MRRESGRERGPRKAEQAKKRVRDEGRLTRKDRQSVVGFYVNRLSLPLA